MKWTPEMVSDLTARWKDGQSATLIGKFFGISRGAVIGKLDRLGLLKTRQRDKALDGPRPVTLYKVKDAI